MAKFYFHIILLIALSVSIGACSNKGNEGQNQVFKKETVTAKNEKLTKGFFQIQKHSKIAIQIQEPAKPLENYTAAKVDVIGRNIESNFSEIASRNVMLGNEVEESLRGQNKEARLLKYKKTWILTVVFDNDIFDNTDYYYTNGVRIELTTPFAEASPLNKILPSAGKNSLNFSGFSIQQNMYTPINPDASEIQYNDRPFSAFLAVGHFRESVNFHNKTNLKSEISFGLVGPASMGGAVQSTIHDIKPVGWQNQVKNDIVLNYSIRFEKGVISNRNIEINATANGNVGTLFDKAGAGFYMRAGSFMPVYRGPLAAITEKKFKEPVQYWFFIRGGIDAVLYDATLQGGIFNNNNPYTISQKNVSRLVYGGSAGLAFYYKQVGLELENFYLSPEFKGAKNFFYGRVKLVATF